MQKVRYGACFAGKAVRFTKGAAVNTNNFQRLGAVSNSHVGNEFEDLVRDHFRAEGLSLMRGFKVPIGIGDTKKPRKFDWGSDDPPVLIECKSHAWTVTGNIPSAKMTVWNEAMYYFYMAPNKFRKVLFTLRSLREETSLAAHYIKCFGHLIPAGVEIWEYDILAREAHRLL
jgi:hypothetical protein